jgi:hypothetical protein
MTMTKKVTGSAIAAAAAGLFAMGYVGTVLAADSGTVQCAGVNSCKGQSDCKSARNSCKGQNACKGQGFVTMTQLECEQAKAAASMDKMSK